MPFIRNRVFGASVDSDTKNFFYNLQKGILDLPPNEEIGDAQPYRDYLGDSIPFVRMWTAVQISSGDDKEIKYFVVNDNNQISYQPNESIQRNIDRGEILTQRVPQLQSNPRMRPAAGITGVTTKTQGALGVIKSTTVEFTVYSFNDFSTYFLPYFLKPGTRIIVDYGWSLKGDPNPLYDIDAIVKDSDDDMSKFYTTVFGYRKNVGKKDESFEPGWINKEPRKGMVDTLFGEVVNYDVTRTDGKWQCSLEIKSANTALLETEITDDNNLKFLFSDFIDTAIIAAISGIDNDQYESLKHNLDYLEPSTRQFLKDSFFTKLYKDGGLNNALGHFTKKSIEDGLFYEEVSSIEEHHEQEKLYINYGLFEDTFLNQALTIAKSDPKIFNPFEVSFNNIDSTVRYSPNLRERQTATIKPHEDIPEFLYPINIAGEVNWNGSYNHKKIMKKNYKVETPAKSSTKLVDPLGPIPFVNKEGGNYFRKWVNNTLPGLAKKLDLDETGGFNNNTITSAWEADGQTPGDRAAATYFVEATQFGKRLILIDGEVISGEEPPPTPPPVEYPITPGTTNSVPLREMFISIPLIIEAFSTKNNINDALVHIWESVNEDSYNVFNIQMIPNNGAHSSIAFHDLNYTIPSNFEKTSMNKYNFLEFDVTSLNSIVTNVDLKFTMPKAGLGSMIAIEGLSGNQVFDIKSLDRLNLLKLLDKKEDRTDMNVTINSLPIVNRKDPLDTDFTTTINIDYSKLKESFSGYGARGTFGGREGLKAKIAEAKTKQDKANKAKKAAGTHTNIEKKVKDNRKQVKVAHSDRDKYAKEAVRDHLLSGAADAVAPILPVELGLSVHGNTLLEIGDFITINFLPEQYRDSSFFQIMGIEHKISSEGWETSYTLTMRIIPNAKRKLVNPGDVLFEVVYSSDFIDDAFNQNTDATLFNYNNEPIVPLIEKIQNLTNDFNKEANNKGELPFKNASSEISCIVHNNKYKCKVLQTPAGVDPNTWSDNESEHISINFDKPQNWDDVVWLYAFTSTMLETIGPTPPKARYAADDFGFEPLLIGGDDYRDKFDGWNQSPFTNRPKPGFSNGIAYYTYQTKFEPIDAPGDFWKEFGMMDNLAENPSLVGSIYDYLSDALIDDVGHEVSILGLKQPFGKNTGYEQYEDDLSTKLEKLHNREIYFAYILNAIGENNTYIFEYLKESVPADYVETGGAGKNGALIFEQQGSRKLRNLNPPVIPPVIHSMRFPARTAPKDQAEVPYKLYSFQKSDQHVDAFNQVNYKGFVFSDYIFHMANKYNKSRGNKPNGNLRIDNMEDWLEFFVKSYYKIQKEFIRYAELNLGQVKKS